MKISTHAVVCGLVGVRRVCRLGASTCRRAEPPRPRAAATTESGDSGRTSCRFATSSSTGALCVAGA